ncbi:FkbM family methyltransferase [Gramella sp. AN32]|uniref:FkbM family methyltransferase n=1 Tax=Christiangramia antarctica TaxID=2058158 RepID=A0ABW5X746_9FLAO|nr:FkbM family methyltransferase [Gramella sp. AN32]
MKLSKYIFKTKKINIDSIYQIGSYELRLPHNHPLPGFQKNHRLYDRFLPILVKYLNPEGIIVDVGANIGDTTIAILQNCKNSIFAIEPSAIFFPYLEKNVNKLPLSEKKRISCFKKFIGTGNIKGEFSHGNGTARIKEKINSSSINFTSLAEIVNNQSSIELIKVDTDGYDYDVLISSEEILKQSEPIIFWENQMFEDFQAKGFAELYDRLWDIGYKYIFIFDNFGNLLLELSDFETLKKINSYVSTMDMGDSTRTFFYTDILATTEKNFSKTQLAITNFKKDWINKTSKNSKN